MIDDEEEEEVKMRTNRRSTADPEELPAAAVANATVDWRKLTATAARLSEESDHQIVRNLESLSRSEQRITLEILLHLIEAEKRKLHVKNGYRSLFDYCTRGLRYSESAAGRRIAAARSLKNYPRVLALLLSGELTVCSLSTVSRILTHENHEDVIARVKGKTRREIDRVVAEFRPVAAVREKVKPVVVRAAAELKTAEGGRASSEDLFEPSNAKRSEIYRRGGGKFSATTPLTTATSGIQSGAVPGDSGQGHDEADGDRRGEPERDPKLKQCFKIEFAADGEFIGNVEKIRSLLSGRFPAGVSMEKLFGIVMDDYLDRHSSAKRRERRKRREERAVVARNNECESTAKGTKRRDGGERGDRGERRIRTGGGRISPPADDRAPKGGGRSRHIPAAIRDEVFLRDGGRCTWVGPDGR